MRSKQQMCVDVGAIVNMNKPFLRRDNGPLLMPRLQLDFCENRLQIMSKRMRQQKRREKKTVDFFVALCENVYTFFIQC